VLLFVAGCELHRACCSLSVAVYVLQFMCCSLCAFYDACVVVCIAVCGIMLQHGDGTFESGNDQEIVCCSAYGADSCNVWQCDAA